MRRQDKLLNSLSNEGCGGYFQIRIFINSFENHIFAVRKCTFVFMKHVFMEGI